MMNQHTLCNFLLGVLLTGSPVVADDARNLETGDKTTADTRRVASLQLHAPATDAASATTSNLTHTPRTLTTNALPPLSPGVTELKFSEFFRQPIGSRGSDIPTGCALSRDGGFEFPITGRGNPSRPQIVLAE